MRIHILIRPSWRTLILVLAVLVAAGLMFRSRALRWGASEAELARAWPGDELLDRVQSPTTRAVTVHAPAEALWPWLMQIGQDRGGFYSYTALENLIGLHMTNVYRIVPEFQKRAVGDTVWFGPRDKFSGQARMVIGELIPNRAMVFVMPPDFERLQRGERARGGIWAFILDPVDAHTTRLVMRTVGGTARPGWRQQMLNYVFWDPAHFVMERKMMLTIRGLAEGAPQQVS